ncbi:esterase [Alicyclobacillus hesperidum]|uniref:Esterase n=1 Tax=Alicyclobacillus hesperidum TaxID=89784 RepID=A0A1H2UV86_9BACL|nr:patatin-like phospholipase family protein [Alicyclobacillus hesperidum]GLV14626.1 esterase [Alicyclobacillus hesperidum]SDW59976.1 NTE family protein [Alicyclobacillus hesperidum]
MADVRVGLALGSGGAKGFAHIGVIAALTDSGVPIHAVTGSSMGALVGGVYAMGVGPNMLRALATGLRRRHWIDFTVPKMGLIQGDKVHEVVALMTRQGTFADTQIPLAIVATDLVARKLVVFRTGLIADAIRASISIPGVFVPVVREGAVYVDGGVIERVPVQAAWDLGVDVVIGVDVSYTPVGTVPTSMLDVIVQSLGLMQDEVYAHRTQLATVNIVPDVAHIGTSQFGRASEAIDIGYRATMEQMDAIWQAIRQAQALFS